MNLLSIELAAGASSWPLAAMQMAAGTSEADNGATWLAIGFGLGLLALLLFAVEIFVPTAGMVGILCGLSAIASIVSFFQYSSSAGGFAILVYLIATPFLLVYGVKLWSNSPIGRRLILGGTDTIDGEGLDEEEVDARTNAMERRSRETQQTMVGRLATTATPLRPIGVIRFDGRRLDALAESGIIEEGIEVEIISVVDNQIKVRAASTPESSSD
ncbi:MAG: hypothetical protein GY895_04650 [Phycisphaera sp.]|nr:hypothetical protein [Phycisphaera sp.]